MSAAWTRRAARMMLEAGRSSVLRVYFQMYRLGMDAAVAEVAVADSVYGPKCQSQAWHLNENHRHIRPATAS